MNESKYPAAREDLTPWEWKKRIFDGGVRKTIQRLEASDDRRPRCVYFHRDRAGNIRYVGRGLRSRPWCHRRRHPRHAELMVLGDLRVEVIRDGLTAREAVRIEREMIDRHATGDPFLSLNRFTGTTMEDDDHVH